MLGFLFGFNARLGRLNFFLCSIAFAVVLTILILVIVQRQLTGIPGGAVALETLYIPLLIIVPLVFWGTLNLYSMRIRDIGWNP